MNKKGAEITIGTIIIITFAMSALILVLVLVSSILEKPEFKITKEECKNENIELMDSASPLIRVRSDKYYSMEDLAFLALQEIKSKYNHPRLLNYEFDDVVNITETYKFYHIWISFTHELEEEICKQIEVDEIEIMEIIGVMTNEEIIDCRRGADMEVNYCNPQGYNGGQIKITIMNKESISFEFFLEKKCNCISYENIKCTKYQCQDYKIEVKQ